MTPTTETRTSLKWVWLCALVAPVALAAGQGSSDAGLNLGALQLGVKTSKVAYRSSDEIKFEISVINPTKTSVWIPRVRDCLDDFMAVWVEDGAGKSVPGGGIVCGKPGEQRTPTFVEQVRLRSFLLDSNGVYLGTAELVRFANFERRLSPGKYRIVVRLNGWRAEQFQIAHASDLKSLNARVLTGSAVVKSNWIELKK